MILGDSLQVMASLAEREGLRGKVQCIYFDPPYGIKFNSNFQWSTTSRDVKDGNADHITREPEQVKAFRDTWRDGIHSYLTYLRDRLTVARDLLTDSGSIFVQIGDENVHRVRAVMDEVFGEDNFVAQIIVRQDELAQTQRLLAERRRLHPLVSRRHASSQSIDSSIRAKRSTTRIDARIHRCRADGSATRPMTQLTRRDREQLPAESDESYRPDRLTSQRPASEQISEFEFRGRDVHARQRRLEDEPRRAWSALRRRAGLIAIGNTLRLRSVSSMTFPSSPLTTSVD